MEGLPSAESGDLLIRKIVRRRLIRRPPRSSEVWQPTKSSQVWLALIALAGWARRLLGRQHISFHHQASRSDTWDCDIRLE